MTAIEHSAADAPVAEPACWLCDAKSTPDNPVVWQRDPKAYECKRCNDEILAAAEKPLGPPPPGRHRA